jgi:molecular chaperone GrpE (heat shock protein)
MFGGGFLSALCEPVKHLHRAVRPRAGGASGEAQALALIQPPFHAASRGPGREEDGVVGEKFDPAMHEAIASQPGAFPAAAPSPAYSRPPDRPPARSTRRRGP